MAETATSQEITITRVYDAPRELVWRAWTEPEQLSRWWGAAGWSNPQERIVLQLEPGGMFSVASVSDADGQEMIVQGVYREIVEPERLVLEEPAEGSWHGGAVSVMTLEDLGDGRTEMVVRTTIQTTDEMRAVAEGGMRTSFERLADHLTEVVE
jgi:uncharacterized protein YndB with AHSA1/START domain